MLVEWTACSPDLNILDTFVRGYIKTQLLFPIPDNTDYKKFILTKFLKIIPGMLCDARQVGTAYLHVCRYERKSFRTFENLSHAIFN